MYMLKHRIRHGFVFKDTVCKIESCSFNESPGSDSYKCFSVSEKTYHYFTCPKQRCRPMKSRGVKKKKFYFSIKSI